MRKTKIICTVGPVTENKETLFKLVKAGINAIRLNFSHGNHEEHEKRIQNLHEISKKTNENIAIILDTQGPEIRTMKLKNNAEVEIFSGQDFIFTTNKKIIGDNKHVAVNYSNFTKDLSIGDRILVDDGLLEMIVTKITKDTVICKVQNNGVLGENKSINLPNVYISLPTLSEKDKKDLLFGIEKNVNFIAASFIQKHKDVLEIRKFLKQHNGEHIQIISKIENQEGINNFDKILEVSDGIMIARGDLGVEIPLEKVIIIQKMIIKKCNYANKIVITATHMLNSMIINPRPTRAEASDVANAILDGTDAVMLSGETAKGKYPIESVKIMAKICKNTDNTIKNKIIKYYINNIFDNDDAICFGVVEISEKLKTKLILVATQKVEFAKKIRKYFPKAIILTLTTNTIAIKQLSLFKGIICKLVNNIKNVNDYYIIGKKIALKMGIIKLGDVFVMISENSIFKKNTHIISIHKV